jgi:alanine racemase
VNLEALRHNLRVVRRHAGSARVWAVLKADAYGHGAPAVARTLERAKVDGFCVALLEEGVELREAGIKAPILVMGGHYGNAHDELIARDLTPVVHDIEQLHAFARLVRSGAASSPVRVHLKVDTGMSRLGVTMHDLPALARAVETTPEVHVEGLMTHLACADAQADGTSAASPRRGLHLTEETQHQLEQFEAATLTLARHGIRPATRHAANSAAVLRGQAVFDAVRPGLALFGVSPDGRSPASPEPGQNLRPGSASLAADLKPAMRVRTEIVACRDVEEGSFVGYGATWRAPRPSRIATLAMGYADGLSRRLSNKGHVLVRGKRAPIVGAVSMDMTMVDVTGIPGASVGDEVTVLGAQEGPDRRAFIGADEIAAHADTIAWEVLTSVSRRVPRFYREP